MTYDAYIAAVPLAGTPSALRARRTAGRLVARAEARAGVLDATRRDWPLVLARLAALDEGGWRELDRSGYETIHRRPTAAPRE